MAAGLPRRVPVTGTDWFLLAFDRAMQAVSGTASVCHLVVELEGDLPDAALAAALAALPAWGWLRALRLRAPVGRVAAWEVAGPVDPSFGRHEVDDLARIPERVFRHEGRPAGAPLVHLDRVRDRRGRVALVLSWHHALLDARGAETLARLLAGDPSVAEVPLVGDPDAARAPGWKDRLLRARDARDFLFDVSSGAVATAVPPPGPGARPRYALWTFDAEAIARVDARAREVGAHLVRSALYLAAVARAVRALRAHRGERPRDVLVPVPQDQRRRGAHGPVVSNWIGTFFYRLSDDELADLPTAVAALTGQLRDMMRAGWTDAYTELLALCRHLPLPAYWRVVAGPTEGAVASFGFSDTGDSLSRLQAFRGVPVAAARHYPADLHPPGLTVIATRYRDELVLCASWLEGALTADEVALLEASVRADLLGAS